MYIGKAEGPVSYIFRALTYPPPCHTIILAINIIVYLCVLLIPTQVGRSQNLILFISLLSALLNSLFLVPPRSSPVIRLSYPLRLFIRNTTLPKDLRLFIPHALDIVARRQSGCHSPTLICVYIYIYTCLYTLRRNHQRRRGVRRKAR